uniref:Uncharacterized protein n=1 Tax=viral metagenome TaxID=1070528 RepID=A0A6M3J7R9_9ZZZZ
MATADLIDDGTTANDGTGDTLRAAFTAINTRYQAAGAGSPDEIRVRENATNGTSYCAITGPASLAGNVITTLATAACDLNKVNYITAAGATTGTSIKLLERTDGGTDGLIITVGDVAIGADRTLTGPTGGDLALESVRLLDAAYTDEAATTGAKFQLLERTDGGTNKLILTVGDVAIAADRTLTGPTGGDLALESVRVFAHVPASSGVAASQKFLEDSDNGTNGVTVTAPASTGDVTFTLPTSSVDMSAVVADNTDGQLSIPIHTGIAEAGTWTKATAAGLQTVTRTAAGAAQSYWIPVPIGNRSTASKGIKPTGLLVNYTLNAEDADDCRFELWKVTQGADNAARTAAALFGEDNADYDEAHNLAAERGDSTNAPELHLATIVDAGAPAFLATGEELLLRVYVDDTTGGNAVFVLTSAILTYTEQLLDYA